MIENRAHGYAPAFRGVDLLVRRGIKRGRAGREMTCLWKTERLFADAEAGEDASQQVVGAERPCDLS